MSSSDEDKRTESVIPLLDENNFPQWLTRMKHALRLKNLFHLCVPDDPDEQPTDDEAAITASSAAAPPTAASVAKNSRKTKRSMKKCASIIASRLGSAASSTILNDENDDKPHLIWARILHVYASPTPRNKARIGFKFVNYTFKGNLSEYVSDFRSMISQLSAVGIEMPAHLLSATILGKLPVHDKYIDFRENILSDDKLLNNPYDVLDKIQDLFPHERSQGTEGRSGTSKTSVLVNQAEPLKVGLIMGPDKLPLRIIHACGFGIHNPNVKGHSSEGCSCKN